jgi:hypothetical protein
VPFHPKGFKGNSGLDTDADNSGDVYGWDYDLFELFIEFGTKVGKYPLSASIDIAMNLGDTILDDIQKNPTYGATYKKETTGYSFAVKFGKAKELGTFDIGLGFRQIGADAVVGAFNDSDFGGGGSDVSGLIISVGVGLGKNASLGITFMDCKTKVGKNHDDVTNLVDYEAFDKDLRYNRFQFDLKIKF